MFSLLRQVRSQPKRLYPQISNRLAPCATFRHPQQIRLFKLSQQMRSKSFKEDPIGWVKRSPLMLWHFCLHLWRGTKLLGLNIWTAAGILHRVANGNEMSRREYRLLVNVASDIVRMVPFSLFIIIPAAELLLPFFLKFFPNMLPSTFTTTQEKEEKYEKMKQARVLVAEFVKETSEEVKNPSSGFQGNFQKFLREVSAGGPISSDQILTFVRTFKDDLTLDNLKRNQIMQMCRFIGIQPYGPTKLLRWKLNYKIDALVLDDLMIHREGLSSLSLIELKSACAARGMESHESRAKLEELMKEWLHLSLNLQVPPSVLILSRAFQMYSRDNRPASDIESLADTIRHMPPEVLEDVEAEVEAEQATAAGDLKEKLNLLREERAKVFEEREEQLERETEQGCGAVAGDIEEVTSATDHSLELEFQAEKTKILEEIEELEAEAEQAEKEEREREKEKEKEKEREATM